MHNQAQMSMYCSLAHKWKCLHILQYTVISFSYGGWREEKIYPSADECFCTLIIQFCAKAQNELPIINQALKLWIPCDYSGWEKIKEKFSKLASITNIYIWLLVGVCVCVCIKYLEVNFELKQNLILWFRLLMKLTYLCGFTYHFLGILNLGSSVI